MLPVVFTFETIVKVFIRQRLTGAFMGFDCKWTKDFRQARIFDTDDQAKRTTRNLHLKNVELYHCYYGDRMSEQDFTLPPG